MVYFFICTRFFWSIAHSRFFEIFEFKFNFQLVSLGTNAFLETYGFCMTAQNFVCDEKESLYLLQIVNAGLNAVTVGLRKNSLIKKLSICENTEIGEEPYSRINLLKRLKYYVKSVDYN